jgi:hypothetical protein
MMEYILILAFSLYNIIIHGYHVLIFKTTKEIHSIKLADIRIKDLNIYEKIKNILKFISYKVPTSEILL